MAANIYVATMVFAIVAGVVSVALLLTLLYVPAASDYAVGIVVIEVGLIGLILNALYRVYVTERDLRLRGRTANENVIAVQTCPDYYTARHNGDSANTVTCTNGVTGANSNATFKFPAGPATVQLSAFDKKPMPDVCQMVNDPKGATAVVPWTELRAKCAAFSG